MSVNNTVTLKEESVHSMQLHETSVPDISNSSCSFFNILQQEINTEIPNYIRNILRLSNLDKPLTFSCITDDTIYELESFARDQMKDFLRRGDNLEDYYGRYHKIPDRFKFVIGDRYLIKELVNLVKGKPLEFWKTNTAAVVIPSFNQVFVRTCGEASSDFDKEEPRQRTPLDANVEQRELIRLVRNVIHREIGVNSPLVNRVKVKVTMKKTFDEQMNQEKILLTGYIKCVVCKNMLTIRKNTFGSYKKPRWVVSNFRRHMRFHVQKGESNEADAIKNLSAESHFYDVQLENDADEIREVKEEIPKDNFAAAWCMNEAV